MREKYFMNKKVQSRKAIAMLELIFAIVIIGITLLSVPNLIYQASESGYTTIQQESIAAAASDLSLILSREWDEVGTSDEFHTPILTTTDGASTLSTRPGGRSRSFSTGLGGAPLPASTIGNDGDFDDIDDAHAQIAELHLLDGTRDLIDVNISITATVNYIVDTNDGGGDNWNSAATLAFISPFTPTGAPLTQTTNIKLISIKLTSTSPVEELADKEIIFNAFSCNIGSYKLERRELP